MSDRCWTNQRFLGVVTLIGLVLAGCNQEKPVSKRGSSKPSIKATDEGPVSLPVKTDVGANLRRAEQWIAAGKPEQCKGILRENIVAQPDHWPSVFLLAQAEDHLGHRSEAIELLAEIPLDDAEFGIAATGQRAQWLAGRGKVIEARGLYEQLLKRTPDLLIVRRQLADLLNKVGWRYEADRVLRPVIESGEATEDELRVSMNRAFPYSRMLPPKPKGTAARIEGPLSRAIGLLEAGKPRKASEALVKWLQHNGDDAGAKAALARSLAEVQAFEELDRFLAQVADDADAYPNYWIAVGDRATENENRRTAVGAYLQALRLDSTHQAAHKRVVSALVREADVDAANRMDDRYFILRSANSAAMALGRGNVSDEHAGKDLVADLLKIGEVELARAWLDKLQSRLSRTTVFREWAAEQANAIGKMSEGEIEERRLCGIDLDDYPSESEVKQAVGRHVGTSQVGLANQIEAEPDTVHSANFVNVATQLGIRHSYRNGNPARLKNLRIFEQVGGGVAACDFDQDGWCDFYCAQAASSPTLAINGKGDGEGKLLRGETTHTNALFRREGDKFTSIAQLAGVNDTGYGFGVTAGDWNQDGFPDLLVGNLGVNRLYVNQGDGTFRLIESASNESWMDHRFTMGVAIADMDGDGIPDLIEVNYVSGSSMYEPLELGPDGHALHYAGPLRFAAAGDRIWMTQGDGELTPLELGDSAQAPTVEKQTSEIGDTAYPGLGLIVSDLDGRPGLEAFVANDLRPNQLWTRKDFSPVAAKPEFIDVAVVSGCAFSSRGQSNACMGVAMGDFDGNAMPDLLVTNWEDEWVNFFLQHSLAQFRDVAPSYRLDTLSEGLLGFGAQAIDYDHNGMLDVVIANGHIDDFRHRGGGYKMPAQLLVNRGRFFEAARHQDQGYWEGTHLGRCVITCDYNRDGRSDVVITDMDEPMVLLENRTESDAHYIQLELVGVSCERDAIGARVEVVSGNDHYVQVAATGDGYQGRNERVLTYGLGHHSEPVTVTISWPNGVRTHAENLPVDQRYLLIEGRNEAQVRHR